MDAFQEQPDQHSRMSLLTELLSRSTARVQQLCNSSEAEYKQTLVEVRAIIAQINELIGDIQPRT